MYIAKVLLDNKYKKLYSILLLSNNTKSKKRQYSLMRSMRFELISYD